MGTVEGEMELDIAEISGGVWNEVDPDPKWEKKDYLI